MIDNGLVLDELQYLMKFQYLMKVEEDEPDKKKLPVVTEIEEKNRIEWYNRGKKISRKGEYGQSIVYC